MGVEVDEKGYLKVTKFERQKLHSCDIYNRMEIAGFFRPTACVTWLSAAGRASLAFLPINTGDVFAFTPGAGPALLLGRAGRRWHLELAPAGVAPVVPDQRTRVRSMAFFRISLWHEF